jgi:uncharacterized protein (DUF1919 family)
MGDDNFSAKVKRRLGDSLLSWYRRKKLLCTDFTVICNNCLASTAVYTKFGLKYNTPTVNLFFYPDDYLTFIENITELVKQPLRFKPISKYETANARARTRYRLSGSYPIGVLGEDIEIQFKHYKNQIEAATKWARRCQRINFDKLFFIFSERDGVTPAHIERYANLPFEHKVFFSSKPTSYPDITIVVKDYFGANEVGISNANRIYEKYFDVTAWLNGGNFHKNV